MVFGFITDVLEMAEVRALCGKAPRYWVDVSRHTCKDRMIGKNTKLKCQKLHYFFLFWLPSNICADMLGKQHTKMLSHHLKQLDEEPRIDEEHFVVLSLQMKRGTVLSGGQCTT